MIKKRVNFFLRTILIVIALLLLTELSVRAIEWCWPFIYQHTFDDTSSLYVYTIGGSTALGVPFEEKLSPAKVIEKACGGKINGKKIQHIVLAQSGKALEYNYFKFYFESLIRPHKNGLLVVYSGINESINNIPIGNFRFWKLIQHSIVLSKLLYICNTFENSPERYAYRYHQLFMLSNQRDYKVIASELVGNYTDLDPVLYAQDKIFSDPDLKKMVMQARMLYDSSRYESAKELFLQSEKMLGTTHPYLSFYAGKCFLEEGKADSARELLIHIPEIDASTGFAQWKNQIIQQSAQVPHTCIAHTYDEFCLRSADSLLGYSLIGDLHHPNLDGYCIMTNEMLKCLSSLYHLPLADSVTKEKLERWFNLDDSFYAGVYYRRVEWFIFESFITEDKKLRLDGAKINLEKFRLLKPNEEIISLWEVMISLLGKDSKAYIASLRKINSTKNQNQLISNLSPAIDDYNLKKLTSYSASMTLTKEEENLSTSFIDKLRDGRE